MKSGKPVPKQTTHQTIQLQQYQGPLPPPESFEHYNHVLPGAAERILVIAEEEQRHRHTLEQAAARDKNLLVMERRIGQVMAFCITVACIITGAWLITKGYSITGTILGTAGIVPVVYAFIPKKLQVDP